MADAPPIPIIRASQAVALFVTGRTDEARAVYETLRQLPAAGDRDVRTLGSLIQLIELMVAYRDTGTAQATYDLFHPLVAHGGGTVGSGLGEPCTARRTGRSAGWRRYSAAPSWRWTTSPRPWR